MKKELIYVAEIPEGVEVTLDGKKLFAKGEKGENERIFHYPGIEMKIEDKKVILSCSLATKKEKSISKSFTKFNERTSNKIKTWTNATFFC